MRTTPSALAGEVVFDGVPIFVSPGAVMTPVQNTVALVDVAVEWIGSRAARVADVGTGTGAVAVAVALLAPNARIWANDDSEGYATAQAVLDGRHEWIEDGVCDPSEAGSRVNPR